MANKDDLILHINELGQKLGRTLTTTGTIADLELRIREAQEELDALDEPLSGDGSDSGTGAQPLPLPDSGAAVSDEPSAPAAGDRVCVRVLRTLHLQAWHPVSGRPVRVAVQDSEVLVNASELPALQKLVVVAE